MHVIFWLDNMTERDNSEDLSVDGNVYYSQPCDSG
jgi:hypothetical protein